MHKITKILSLWFFVGILMFIGIVGIAFIPFLNLIGTPAAILGSLVVHMIFFIWLFISILKDKDT